VIYQEVQSIIDRYDNPISIMEGLDFSQSDTIRVAEFYSNSKYLGGDIDELGRTKPFYNIVNFRVTLAKVATDMDVKDVYITSDNPAHQVKSMLLNAEAYEWMKESDFSTFLNKLGYKRAKYGGVIIKKREEKGKLTLDVVDWRNIYTDQIDILNNLIVEEHYLTPIELKAKSKVWDDVDEALKELKEVNAKARKEEDKLDRIKVYEVHGQFPIKFLKEAKGEECTEDDEFEYSQQVYYIGVIKDKTYYFFSDTEKESPYDYLPWEEMEGRALGRGVIEDSEQAQIWTNHSVINENNAMDLAGRVVMKTNSKKVGQNILEVDTGKIFELEEGADINPVNLTPSALGQFQNQINRWRDQVDNATSAYDAITGEQPPSGTPYSQSVFLSQVASRPYDYRIEEQAIFLNRLFTRWIIPHLKKRLYKKHILVSEYSEDELKVIDNAFVKHTNKIFVDKLLERPLLGEPLTQSDYDSMLENLMSEVKGFGSKRYIEIPEGYFDDIEAKITIMTSNEQKNKAIILQSLSSVLQTVVASYDPNTRKFAVLEEPKLSKIFGLLLETSGIPGLTPASLGIGQQSEGETPAPSTQQMPELLTGA
jgi:hypothetical protein